MDDLDREILGMLRRDARTPYTDIPDRVGTSEGPICNRVERLSDEGVIERFTVSTGTGSVTAMIEIGVDANVDTAAIADRIVEWEEVDFVWQVSGEEDMVVVVDAADTQASTG